MRNLILFGLFIILLLVAQFASAKTVDEIIDRYVKARGGKHRLASLKSIYMEGIKESTAGRSKIKIIKEQARLNRVETETGDVNEIKLVTDKEGWSYIPLKSTALHDIIGKELEVLQYEMDIAGPLFDYVSKGYKAELLGKEIVEGNTCYKIKLTGKDDVEMVCWIDSGTYLLHGSTMPGIVDKVAGGQTYTFYKNYREIDGVLFPHTYEKGMRGSNSYNLVEEITFNRIILNPLIDSKMFLPEIG